MKGLEMFLIVAVVAFVLWLTVSRSNEKFSADDNMSSTCVLGCLSATDVHMKQVNDSCEKKFTTPTDIDHCIKSSNVYKGLQDCKNACFSSCK